MNVGVFIANAVSALLLPPLNLLLICSVGLLLIGTKPRAGAAMSASALMLLLLLSTKTGSLLLVGPLENSINPLVDVSRSGAQAIVVLGGGRLASAPEYAGKDIPNMVTLARLRYAARLARDTGLPVLVTGGMPDGSAESEAAGMARALREDFRISVKWTEERSNTTAENATYSATMLKAAGIRRVLLVTDAMHMPRSRLVFEHAGLEVVPAPTLFFSHDRFSLFHLLPSGEGMRRSHYAAHEWIGAVWYRLRH